LICLESVVPAIASNIFFDKKAEVECRRALEFLQPLEPEPFIDTPEKMFDGMAELGRLLSNT